MELFPLARSDSEPLLWTVGDDETTEHQDGFTGDLDPKLQRHKSSAGSNLRRFVRWSRFSTMLSTRSPSNSQNKKRPLISYIWDTWDKSPEERRFLTRLDACLLSYLDQQNVINAYVSGMKDDLELHGNQLNYITAAWTVGYVIGQIPSNMLITRIRPSLWIPAMEVIWGALTMLLATSKSFKDLITIRFFVGLAESTFYPAIQYVIGSWYKSEELGKRACIFQIAGGIGPMFSGFLQAGAYNGLNGRYGLAGWQWLFLIDGLITVPIGLLGLLVMPDLPHNTKPSALFTEAQIAMARRRMEQAGRKPPSMYTKKKIIGFFRTWHIYALVTLYIFYNNGANTSLSMIFWLQSFNIPGRTVYSIAQINLYPLGINVVQIITTLVWAWWSDAIGARWPPMIVAGIWSMINCIVLASTPLYTHITRRWIFYYFTSCGDGLSGLILAWANELLGHDNEKRSFVIASCNAISYIFLAWVPIVLFPQVEQPRVLKGTIATIFINLGMVCFALVTRFLEKRDERKKRKSVNGVDETESALLLNTEVESSEDLSAADDHGKD